MKKSFLFALTAILLVPTVVFAQSDENVTKRRPDRPAAIEIQEIRDTQRANVAELHATRLEKRFKFYYSRLNNIMMRFQTRLDLLSKGGKSTATSQTQLNSAKAKLEDAKLKGEATVKAFREIDPAKLSVQKTEILAATSLATEARKLFQDVLDLLKLALKELKTISKPALPAASSAVQNTLE